MKRHPDDGDPADEGAPLAQLPRALLERVARSAPQEDRDDVGDVEPDHADRRHGEVRDDRTQPVRRRHQQPGQHRGEPDRVRRGPGALVDRVPPPVAGDRTVAREGVDHARVRRDRGHAAEELRTHHDDQREDRRALAEGLEEDPGRSRDVAGRRELERRGDVVARLSFHGVPHRQQQDVAEEHRDHDRLPDPVRARDVGFVRLLGHVRRGVVAGDRVLGQQHADQEHVGGDRPGSGSDSR